ncbi:MAG: hypothetical protein E6Q85_06215 [Thiothrix sp.]|nr:MAG: hypothetical protein E6Q85_06215 [Thiothrix sp.]
MENTSDLIEVGNTVRLSRVAEQIAEIEGGDADILWVIRLCIDRGVRVCIKIAEPIYVWRWGSDPGFYADLPVTGMGDYIEPLTGVVFLFSSTLETLIIDRVVKCSSLYLPNDSWDGGVEHLDIASYRHFLKQAFAEELKNKSTTPGLKRIENDIHAMIDGASDTDYVVIDTNDLYMSKKDMGRLFQVGVKEEEAAFKISENDAFKNTVHTLPKYQPTEIEPILKSRDPEGQKKWIEYHVQQKGCLLEDFCNLPNGIKEEIKKMAEKKGISRSVVDDRWKELRRIHQFPQ